MSAPTPYSKRSVRRILSVSIVVVGLLAVLSSGALIATTSALQRTTSDVAAAVESVRLVEEAEISLLLHARATDPVVKRDIESELRSSLDDASKYVTSAGERSVLETARASVDRYLQAAPRPGAEAAAFAALEQLVAINLEHTRAAHQEAVEWDRIANVTGVVVGALIVVIAIGLILWLRRQLVRPWFALADTLRRFGEGERVARAEENGPLELREMSRRFNEMAESIATQREAQLAFLGGVAHDLRNPLSALGLAVDLLDPSEPLPPEAQLRRTIAVIARQIHHLDRMVGDFVDMSTIEAGKLGLHVDYHDVRAIVRDAVGLFAHTDAAAERLRLSLPREPCLALCDDVRISQVVTNIVSNAIKYSPASEPIDIQVVSNAHDAIVEVTDRGAGITREDHRRIFEPFRRVGATGTTMGTGLGLFNVQRIVEAHGGRIEVESVPSRGSTFRIYLRLAQTRAPASVSAALAPHSRS